MSWNVAGRGLEMCSCKVFCPCFFGPEGEPDKGWCSGLFAFDIRKGESDGVDLTGVKLVLFADWPSNFFHGQGKARLYIDAGADDQQRRELEAIFGGKKDGFLSALWDAVIAEWLPAQTAEIELEWNGAPSLKLNGLGRGTLAPLDNGAGQPATISGTAAQAALQIDSMNIARPEESEWADPDLRRWRAEDGVLFDFNWSS